VVRALRRPGSTSARSQYYRQQIRQTIPCPTLDEVCTQTSLLAGTTRVLAAVQSTSLLSSVCSFLHASEWREGVQRRINNAPPNPSPSSGPLQVPQDGSGHSISHRHQTSQPMVLRTRVRLLGSYSGTRIARLAPRLRVGAITTASLQRLLTCLFKSKRPAVHRPETFISAASALSLLCLATFVYG
jgi:hypothetical protein